MEPQKRRWLRVNEVAALLNCHPVTIRKMLARRELPFVKRKGLGVLIDWPRLERQFERAEVLPPGK